jgi:hypothetical protein
MLTLRLALITIVATPAYLGLGLLINALGRALGFRSAAGLY